MKQGEIDEDTRAYLLDGKRLLRFIHRLDHGKRTRAKLDELWTAFASTYDDLPNGPQRRLWLLAVLQELSEQSKIRLPVRHGKQWDRTSTVALPAAVIVCGKTNERPAADWRQFPWHPQLQWILSRRHLKISDFAFLSRVNQGIVEGWFHQSEPFKYRSLQLTGDEKRLAKLLKCSSLFESGKLSLEMLGCERDVLPVAIDHFSSNPRMLLFENAAPFMVARRMLPQATKSRIGCIAYGAGKQILKSVGYFPTLKCPIEEILYVGDLDCEGIQIAATVSLMSTKRAVRPATLFHLAMFDAATTLGSSNGWPAKEYHMRYLSDSALKYLNIEVRDRARALVEAGRRIPEEVVSHSLMHELLNSI
jgi:hypothetical protein